MIVDLRSYPSPHRKRRRTWLEVTGILLHQTACLLGERPARWRQTASHAGTAAHFGVTRGGQILRVHDLAWVTPHGHGFNRRCVGIELDGAYEGIEGQPRTFWKGGPVKVPMTPTPALIAAAAETIALIVAEVASHGGRVAFLVAHRQAAASRRGDPGSALWQAVALPAMRVHGLSDGGAGFRIGTGRGIPEEWDAARVGVGY